MEHLGKIVTNVVSQSMGDHVISVKVSSRPIILPKFEDGPIKPPVRHRCFDRHIIRTSEGVVIVEVMARVKVLPSSVLFSQIVETAREELDATLKEEKQQPTPEDYASGLHALTQRLVWRLRKQGVIVKGLK
jgi:hypothetical protein